MRAPYAGDANTPYRGFGFVRTSYGSRDNHSFCKVIDAVFEKLAIFALSVVCSLMIKLPKNASSIKSGDADLSD